MSNDQATSVSLLGRTKEVEIGVKKRIQKLYRIGQIFFPTAGFTLDDQDKNVLKEIARTYEIILLGHPGLSLFFIGYADHRGDTGYNLKLSKQRTETVSNYFKNYSAFRNNHNWNCILDPKGEKESYQPTSQTHLSSGKRNLIKIMRIERRVDIYSNIKSTAPLITKGDLIITVLHSKTKQPVANVEITLEYGARSKMKNSNSRGKINFNDINAGNYSIYCDDINYKMNSWKTSDSKKTSNDLKAQVRIQGGKTIMLEIMVIKKFSKSVKWIEKTLEYHSGYAGKMVTKSTRVIREKYEMIPEDWVEYGVQEEELERKPIFPGDVYYIKRYHAVYKIPDGKYYAAKVGKIVYTILKVIFFMHFDLESKAEFVYNNWDEYPIDKSDPLEKYRPSK